MNSIFYWIISISIFISAGRQFYIRDKSLKTFIRETITTTITLSIYVAVFRWVMHFFRK